MVEAGTYNEEIVADQPPTSEVPQLPVEQDEAQPNSEAGPEELSSETEMAAAVEMCQPPPQQQCHQRHVHCSRPGEYTPDPQLHVSQYSPGHPPGYGGILCMGAGHWIFGYRPPLTSAGCALRLTCLVRMMLPGSPRQRLQDCLLQVEDYDRTTGQMLRALRAAVSSLQQGGTVAEVAQLATLLEQLHATTEASQSGVRAALMLLGVQR